MKNHKLMFHLGMFSTVICIIGYFIAKSQNIDNMDIYFIFFGVFNFLSAINQFILWNKKDNENK